MNRKPKKTKAEEAQRASELFQANSEIIEALSSKIVEYKLSPREIMMLLNTLYSSTCDTIIGHRKEGITLDEVKGWLLKQVDNLKEVVESLPVIIEDYEQKEQK